MGIIPENVNFVLPFEFATCSHSLMDRISDSGSDGYGSNPYGGTDDGGRAPVTVPAADLRSAAFAS